MKSWKASEFCKKIFDGTHESPKYVKFGKKLITSKYISSGLDLDHAPFISENDFSLISQRSKVEKMDVLFSMIGTVGTTYLVRQDPDYAIKNIGVFRAKTPIDAEYLFYFFQSPHFQHSLKGNLVGSTQKFLGLNQLKQLEISVPENIGEERHIVDTIGSVDRLIRSNQEKINCLSAIIKSEFWKFYNAIPERNSTIGANFECVLGGTPKTDCSEYWDGNINWINSGALNSPIILKATRKITQQGLDHSAAKIMKSGTTVVAITGATLGQTSLLAIDASGNQSVVGILENDNFKRDFIFPLLLAEMPVLSSRKTGGAQLHINKQDFLNLPIKIPAQSTYRVYSKKVMPLFIFQTNLAWENEKLEALRKVLLLRYF